MRHRPVVSSDQVELGRQVELDENHSRLIQNVDRCEISRVGAENGHGLEAEKNDKIATS
jgi:ribosomal 50S subunit-recycling heat shock protein